MQKKHNKKPTHKNNHNHSNSHAHVIAQYTHSKEHQVMFIKLLRARVLCAGSIFRLTMLHPTIICTEGVDPR